MGPQIVIGCVRNLDHLDKCLKSIAALSLLIVEILKVYVSYFYRNLALIVCTRYMDVVVFICAVKIGYEVFTLKVFL